MGFSELERELGFEVVSWDKFWSQVEGLGEDGQALRLRYSQAGALVGRYVVLAEQLGIAEAQARQRVAKAIRRLRAPKARKVWAGRPLSAEERFR